MVLSLLLGAVLLVLGATLLFYAKHLDVRKNKEIALTTMGGYSVLAVAFLCGAITGVIAINENVIVVVVIGAAEAILAAIVVARYFISWMDSDIHEGYPSN